jgi:hypothetical protein
VEQGSAAAPPGDVHVQRGANHPRSWCRMPADRAPRGPGPGKGLGDNLLGRNSLPGGRSRCRPEHIEQQGAVVLVPARPPAKRLLNWAQAQLGQVLLFSATFQHVDSFWPRGPL